MIQFQDRINLRKINNEICALDIHGQLNNTTEEALTAAYNLISSNGVRAIILNFEKLNYMNSSGIGLLVTLLIRARRHNQKLFAVGLSSHYRQIFHHTRLEESIPLADSEEAVITQITGARMA